MANPICLGMIDAAPAAQGCLLVRWFEMITDPDSTSYRYDFHVKPLIEGLLIKAEIDAGTWYSRSLKYPDQGSPSILPYDSPEDIPEILQALIGFEAYEQNFDNVHLFTNQQYQVAVRAVQIDLATDVIAEDDNDEVVTSYSSGYQGVQWSHIVSWPELEISAIPALNVAITVAPDVNLAEGSTIGISEMPQLDSHIHRGGE